MHPSHALRQLAVALTFAFLLAIGLAACGGGSSTELAASPPPAAKPCDNTVADDQADCGDVYLELTDADGDFLAYAVNVTSVRLERRDGTVVELLPNRTRIDFAQYVDLTEILTAARVPWGTYTKVELTLDYAAAEVVVEKDGAPVTAEVHLPPGRVDGTALFTVTLDASRPLVVAPGLPALVTLDFDLAASHTVVVAQDPPQVNLNAPVLVATLDRELDERPHRIRGPLLGADLASSRYTIAVRPMHQGDGHFGRLVVRTGDATEYEIDGVAYQGAAGLAVLAALPQGSATVAVGRFDPTLRAYLAARVQAGSSVPGGTLDGAAGSVRARAGDTLTVHGGTLVRADGSFAFAEAIAITLDAETVVRRVGLLAPLDASAISVGSRLEVLGVATVDPESGAVSVAADFVRILPTLVAGTAQGVADATLTAGLQSVDRRPVALYDFAGTGTDAAHDADPAAYEVALGMLTGAGLEAGAPVGVAGFVRAFGTAPADFDAIAVTDYSSARAELKAGWGETGSLAPFALANASGLELDLADPALGALHHLVRGPVATDLAALPANPRIVSADEPLGFALAQGGTVQTFAGFAEWSAALEALLAAGHPLRGLGVRGDYDADQARLTAYGAVAVFAD
jgi:hypothetical protein